MKKTLAMILTLALVICMMPTSAFADGAQTPSTSAYDLSKATVTISSNVTYDGDAHVPTVTVKAEDGTALVEKTALNTDGHYNLSWKLGESSQGTSEFKAAGIYTPVITAVDGKSTGTPSNVPTYEIQQLDLSDAGHVKIIGTDTAITSANVGTIETNSANLIAVQYVTGGKTVTIPTSDYNVTKYSQSVDSVMVTVAAKSANVKNQQIGSLFIKTVLDSSYSASVQDQIYNGTAQEPPITFKKSGSTISLTKGADYSVTWNNNTNASAKTSGKATFTVTGTGKYTGTLSGDFTIIAKDISKTTIDIPNVIEKENLVVNVTDGNKKLDKGTDYTFTDDGTLTAAVGTKSLTITGLGNYKGSVTKNYTVVSKSNTLVGSDFNIKDAGTNKIKQTYYNGSTQSVTLAVLNSAKANATYRIEYRKNDVALTGSNLPKDAGDYDVYAIGTGNYAGEAKAGTLRIQKIPLDWTEIVLGSYTVYDSVSRTYVPKVTLVTKAQNSLNNNVPTWAYNAGFKGNVTILPETDYKVGYRYVNSTSSYLKPTAYATVNPGAINLGDAFVSSVKEVTKEFSTATKSIANYLITFEGGRSSSAYTAAGVTPKVVVKESYNSTPLKLTQDYTVTYKNAAGKEVKTLPLKDAGTYSVIVTGTGAYYGSQTLTYTITGTDIGNYTVTLKESKVNADGRSKTPVITSVAYGYASKLNTTDYTVSYQDSTGKEVKSYQMSAPGTYRVVVTGKNGYTGSCYANFTIEGLAQSITGVESSYKIYPTSDAFKLQAKATEGTITYTSSDPSVASVDAYGYVTPHKAGRAKITISTTGNVRYNPANDSTVIKVYPNKAKLTRKPWKTGKGKIKVRWNKQDNVTRYEVRYSRNKSFKKGTYKTKKRNAAVNSYTTQSTTISGLYSGYTYYVKVRAVKEVYNDYGKKLTYYGRWSGWKSVRA